MAETPAAAAAAAAADDDAADADAGAGDAGAGDDALPSSATDAQEPEEIPANTMPPPPARPPAAAPAPALANEVAPGLATSTPAEVSSTMSVSAPTVTDRAPPPEPHIPEPAVDYAPASTAPSSQLNQRAVAKARRPYTITKKRETWTEEEHKKFLEALHFYHRDWKKIAAHVGTRTVFQARSHAQKYFSKVIKYGTGEYVPAPRPKKKQRVPRSKVGVASRGTHWTPADIPAGQIKEEPQLPPMYFDRLHRRDSATQITPGAVLDSALKQKSAETMLPTITAVVEDATKAVEEQLYDIPATNTPMDLVVDETGNKELQNHMVSPDVKVLKNGQVLSTWHQVQLRKAQDIYVRAVREALFSMEIPPQKQPTPAPVVSAAGGAAGAAGAAAAAAAAAAVAEQEQVAAAGLLSAARGDSALTSHAAPSVGNTMESAAPSVSEDAVAAAAPAASSADVPAAAPVDVPAAAPAELAAAAPADMQTETETH